MNDRMSQRPRGRAPSCYFIRLVRNYVTAYLVTYSSSGGLQSVYNTHTHQHTLRVCGPRRV